MRLISSIFTVGGWTMLSRVLGFVRDVMIAGLIGPILREKGLLFVGLDIIGDYLTEINVTSPTCIREIDAAYDLDIGSQLMDCIDEELSNRT